MRVLVTGASGQLGSYLLRELAGAADAVRAWSGSRSGSVAGVRLQPVDLADEEQVRAAYRDAEPEVIVHAAALAGVADCQRDPARAERVNVGGTQLLVRCARETGARLVFVSTDLVFDGERGGYREADPAGPLSVYGRTKLEAERVTGSLPASVVVRVSLMYGPSGAARPSFFDQFVAALREHRPFCLYEDEWRTPIDYRTAARALVEIARSTAAGCLHVGGPERMSRWEMGERIARHMGLDAAALRRGSRADSGFAEPRPRDTSLDSSLWRRQFPALDWPVLERALDGLRTGRAESCDRP